MPKVVFIEANGARKEVEAPVGSTLLQIAHMHKMDLEGSCDHSLACATCHVVVDPQWYELLAAPAEEELDMLDLAPNLAKTSRLGCQIVMREEFDGLTVNLPKK
ncbi:MAG TPA: 2Fe-2S iron-sulfur cluster-binding protein [Alphaproteobacteria bacterium]|nr:2Fe-2S iron-sulfur cluster-binding protein [Alphaproteobacteria bacterium]